MPRVLLIEDNAGDVELVRQRLAGARGAPFELVAEETLDTGIATYRSHPADAVLLDLNLPDSGGLSTVEAFREAFPDAPVIVLTGTADMETALEAIRRGADDYVAKNELNSDLLTRTIRYAIERRRVTALLEKERATVAILQESGAALASELNRERLVQKIIDLATAVVGASFGAFFYHVSTADGVALRLYSLTGPCKHAFDHLGTPRVTPLLAPTLSGSVVRADDVRLDPRYGHAAPHFGLPPGHPAVASYLAVPITLRNGVIAGGLWLGHTERARFTMAHERLAVGVAGWAAVAMDNARLYEEAVQTAQARENLLQVVSHDLRNHVNTMSVGIQLLRHGVAPDQLRRFDAVERASTTMRRLLEDLVDIAAVEKGVLSVSPERVETGALLDDARALLEPVIAHKGIGLAWEVAEPHVGVQVDRERFLQVLGNLVGNAVKFTPADGRITVSAMVRDSEVLFAVEDTGPGIPESDRERVFDRFFRGSRPSGHGAGLGLAIARALVQAHGGHIRVDGAPGKGARFEFTLPRGARE